jgi:hypothetical protein
LNAVTHWHTDIFLIKTTDVPSPNTEPELPYFILPLKKMKKMPKYRLRTYQSEVDLMLIKSRALLN